jgi:proline dehydrogenase
VFRESVIYLSELGIVRSLVTTRRAFRPLVRRFVAGEHLEEAIAAARALNDRGLKVTLDHLGESVAREDEAVRAAGEYIPILDAIARDGLDANVSLKPSHMGIELDPDLAFANVRRVAERARELGIFVRVDMESHHVTQATLDLVERLRADGFPDVGVVIQSCLYRSRADVERLNALGTRVRLCKGAYLEPREVAYPKMKQVDESYATIAESLLADGLHPAFATHDARLIEHIQAKATSRGLQSERFEFQMLYGIRRDLQLSLVDRGYTVRVYVPFGVAWYPYLTRRLAERPANALFFARAAVRR